ncbi:MAG: hypothetical protein ACR2KV_00560 [Solirubrobacteraceae bacterium]
MATHQFKFAVSDVELTDAQVEGISQAIGLAGSQALAGLTPPDSVAVQVGRNIWWHGIPGPDVLKALQQHAAQQAG